MDDEDNDLRSCFSFLLLVGGPVDAGGMTHPHPARVWPVFPAFIG